MKYIISLLVILISVLPPKSSAGFSTSEDGATVVTSANTLNFIEPDTTLVTETPSGTARIDTSQYVLQAGRLGGQTIHGGTDASSTSNLVLNASSTGVLGGNNNNPLGVIINDNVTTINGVAIALFNNVSADIDASSTDVAIAGLVMTSDPDPIHIIDDTNQISLILFGSNLTVTGDDKFLRDRSAILTNGMQFLGDTSTLTLSVMSTMKNSPFAILWRH